MAVVTTHKQAKWPTPERVSQLRKQAKEGPNPKLAALVLSAIDYDSQARDSAVAQAETELLDDPYQTCAYGHHNWRMVSPGEFVCIECGSTDPEGDQAQ